MIISQVAFHYVRRKDHALEEIVRVLRSSGQAHLHIDTVPPSVPDFFGTTPRFVVYQNDVRVPVEQLLGDRCGDVLVAQSRTVEKDGGGNFTIMRILKAQPGTVNLGLNFDVASSFSLEAISAEENRGCLYGYRSVFRCQ